MRKKLLSMLVLLTAAAPGTWAQDEVTLTPQGEGAWTLVMPEGNVELQIEYYTDEEVAEMEEAAFTEGVELTANDDGTWTLAAMPTFDIELEVEYDDFTTAVISIKNGQVDTVTYYDLNGRRLAGKPAVKGVFIQNGKKVVIK